MLEKVSQADMEEGEGGQDLATTVLTCEGDLRDPGFPGRLQSLVLRLRELISDEEQPLWVKKVEPWNSVRVTFTLPRDAALRLRQLAQRGDQALRELGILSVQVEGDQIISLTLAGRYGEPPKEIIIQKAAEEGEQDSAASAVGSGAASSSAVAGPSSSRAGPSSSPSSSSTVPAEPASIPRNPAFAAVAAASTSSGSSFRSPNVVAPPPREPLPFLSSGSSRFVRPATKTRPPFPFASMTHSMKQNSAAAAATTSGSRFPFSPSPPLAAALGAAAQRMGGASRGNVALSSPLLVNLLQSETGSGPQKLMMPPPLDTGQPTKRKRRPPKGSRGKEGSSPPGSPSPPPPTSPSCDAASMLGTRSYPLSHIPLSPPRTAPPSSTVSVAPPSPPTAAESRATTHLINPFTGHLEPMPSDEEDDEPAVRDLETSESSENGGHSERSLSDGSSGKDPGNPSSDTDSGIGKSCSSQSPNESEPLAREEVSRVSLPPSEGEKLKLRLKLDSKRSSLPVKALDVEASPPPSPQGEPPRVPPLHISLRGPNVAVVVSPRKPEAAAAAAAVPKKRSPRSPRSSNADSEARRGCRGARARGDKASERMRELSLLSGGGIVRVPVSMSPTVVLTPLQLQHPLGPARRTLPNASPSSSSSSSSPSSSSPSSASSSCAQSTKPHWSATSLGPEADSSVSDGSSPLRDRPDLPHGLRSADHPDSGGGPAAMTPTPPTVATPLLQAGNGEPAAANSALGALECHATPHRTARPGGASTPETNGVLHPDDQEEAARHSPSPCRTSPPPAAKTTSAIEKKNPLTGCLEGGTNHIGSAGEDAREVAERRLSPPMARIISLDTVTAKKAAFGPVFEVSEVDVPAALKLGGLVGGNHRMPLLIPQGGGGAAFRGDVMLRQEYAATHHHFHCSTTANSVLKPGIVRMNRLRFGAAAGFAAAAAATQARMEAAPSVMVKTNGIAASPPQNECDSTMDAESSLDSDDLVTNGPTSTTPVSLSSLACVTSQTLSATSAIVSRSDGFSSDLPASSRGVCDSASNGNAEFAAVAGSDNGVTTTGRTEEGGDSVSPDSNHERLPQDRLDPGDTDSDKNGDGEASPALSEGKGSSVLPPSEEPSSNIPPDRPSSAPPPTSTSTAAASPPPSSSTPEPAVVVSSQSTASPLSETAAPSSPLAAGACPPRPSSSPATWDCAPTEAATAAPPRTTNPQPSDSGVVGVPSSTMQVPGGRMISPSKWSGDPQQRLTFILKGSLPTGASSLSSTAPTHPMLALPAGGGNAAKPVPMQVVSLPPGASSLTFKSSLAELVSPPNQVASSGSVSPPLRLVVSKVAPMKAGAVSNAATASSSSSPNNTVTKSVVVAGASLQASEEAPTSTLPVTAPSSEAVLSFPASAAVSEPVASGVCEVPVEAPVVSREQAVCAVVTTTPSVVVTVADTRAAGAGGSGECVVDDDDLLSVFDHPAVAASCVTTGSDELAARLSPPATEALANHVGSPPLPDSLSSLLDLASEPPEDDESEAASAQGSPLLEALVNHRDDEEGAREHLADLELLRSCSGALVIAPDDLGETGRLRNRRRVTQVLSPILVEGDEEEGTPLLAASPSDHSSEEDLSLSELAHKSRVRHPPPPPPPSRPVRQGGKENEALAALDSPAPTTRREDGGPGRPRRMAAGGVEAVSRVAARLRLGQQQQPQPAVPPSQQPQAPAHLPPPLGGPTVAPLPAEEALRRTTADRSRRSPATTPVGRDHRSPPRQTNQRNFRRDSEVRDEDAVVVMKRKTRASGPSTDAQQEAAAPNKRRRYSKDSHR